MPISINKSEALDSKEMQPEFLSFDVHENWY